MFPISEPEDDPPGGPEERQDYSLDDQLTDDFGAASFFSSSSRQDVAGQLWATEREPVESRQRTPIVPRVLGGSAMVLAVVAAITLSPNRQVRRHPAPASRPGAITMIFVPSGSPLWASTVLKKLSGRADHRHMMRPHPATVFATLKAPKVATKLAEVRPPALMTPTVTAVRPHIAVKRPAEFTGNMASPASSAAIAGKTAGPVVIASSTLAGSHPSVPAIDTSRERLAVAAKPVLPQHTISGKTGHQPDAHPLRQSASESALNSLPSSNAIHLEIFYGSQNAKAARSVAALYSQLRSKVVGINSLNIRAGDAKSSIIAYFFPSDRAGARAIAAGLRQIGKQFVPVELLHRVPQPRPGTVEIFIPSDTAKGLIDAG